MISRRQLIKVSLSFSGSLVLQIPLPAQASATLLKRGRYFDAWLEISRDNQLLFSLDKVEMGQGVVNSLVAIIAEEINTDPLMIDVQLPVVGYAQRNPLYQPSWGTGGSSSVHSLWPVLRKTGAMLNHRMLVAASRRWVTDPSHLHCHQAHVINPVDDRNFSFADLITDVVDMDEPAAVFFKTKSDYQWVGKKIPGQDIEAKVTGKPVYCSDIRPANVPVAVVIRCPYPEGKLLSYQWQKDKKPDDVSTLVIGEHLVLLGTSYHQVDKVREYLVIEWQLGRSLPVDNKELRKRLLAGLEKSGETVFSNGNAPSPVNMEPTLSATYFVPYLAHATLEPMNCTVLIEPGSWVVWAPTQKPAHALSIAAKISGLPPGSVSVHTGFLGGGFGRRLKQDYVVEACLIAKELGHSVQVLWSREDDFRHGFYRPAIAARVEVRAGRTDISELLYRVASSESAPIVHEGFMGAFQDNVTRWWRRLRGQPVSYNQAVDGVYNLTYEIGAQEIQLQFMNIGLPTGLWRSVGNSFSGFFIESFIDELAWHFQRDPIEYRLSLLKESNLKNVLSRVWKLSGWVGGGGVDMARGVACYKCFGTAVAMVVDINVVDGVLGVSKVWCVIDCGLAIDPDGIRKQVEGAINFGLCAALFGELQIAEGRVESSNFHDYPVLRIHQSPDIEVDIMDSDRPPTGVGEPATPLIAPALYNAVFALTGERYRELPLTKQLQDKFVL